MDLNYLLACHQTSLMRAEAAPSREARHAHSALTHGYAAQIRRMQQDTGGTFMLTGIA